MSATVSPPGGGSRPTFVRDAALILGIPAVALGVILALWRPWEPTRFDAPGSVYDAVAGTWDWAAADSFCVANPHRIGFSGDRSVMILTHLRPWTDSTGAEHQVTEYDLQRHDQSGVTGAIRGEKRVTEAGEPVIWELILTSADSYTWHRTDWPAFGRTNPVRRCPTSADRLFPSQ